MQLISTRFQDSMYKLSTYKVILDITVHIPCVAAIVSVGFSPTPSSFVGFWAFPGLLFLSPPLAFSVQLKHLVKIQFCITWLSSCRKHSFARCFKTFFFLLTELLYLFFSLFSFLLHFTVLTWFWASIFSLPLVFWSFFPFLTHPLILHRSALSYHCFLYVSFWCCFLSVDFSHRGLCQGQGGSRVCAESWLLVPPSSSNTFHPLQSIPDLGPSLRWWLN